MSDQTPTPGRKLHWLRQMLPERWTGPQIIGCLFFVAFMIFWAASLASLG